MPCPELSDLKQPNERRNSLLHKPPLIIYTYRHFATPLISRSSRAWFVTCLHFRASGSGQIYLYTQSLAGVWLVQHLNITSETCLSCLLDSVYSGCRDHHHEEVEISEDGTKAEKVFMHGNGVVYTEVPVKGHVVFEVEVLSVNNDEDEWNIGIGIMIHKSDTPLKKSEIPKYTIYAPDHCMWHDDTVYNNMMGMAKRTEKKYGEMHLINVRKGDRLGVLITSSGELQFLLNGKPQGIAAHNIYRPGFDVYLAVDHFAPYTATRILSSKP